MAIAGSAMQSYRVRLILGQPVGDAWMLRQSDVLTHDVAEAAKKLLAGEIVYLRATGPQFVLLQQMFNQNDEKEAKE